MDCIDSDLNKLCDNVYKKITTMAKDLVATGEEIGKEFGIPIVNKRISVTPIALIGGSACKTPDDFVKIAQTLDRAAKTVGVNFIGGYTALVSKKMTQADKNLILSIPKALATTEYICSSVNVGSTKTGLDMDAILLMGKVVKETAVLTKDNDSIGCAKLVVFCNAPDDNPFMAGAFHGVTEGDAVINVGVSGPGVVKTALDKVKGKDFSAVCETIKKTAFKITRVGQLVAHEASKRLGVPFGIIDLSLAPTPAVGDSIAEIFESLGLERAGAPGTTCLLYTSSLDMMGVEQAYDEIRKEQTDSGKKFFCVGYSIVKYYLNGYPMEMIEMHMANYIEVELIATFLPEEVVDGLYSAVELAGLHVASLTLEPIAAINMAIPEKFRLLNIALVDVGAGTSDISIVKDGSIIAVSYTHLDVYKRQR